MSDTMPDGDKIDALLAAVGGRKVGESGWNLWGGYLRRSRAYNYSNSKLSYVNRDGFRIATSTRLIDLLDLAFFYGIGRIKMGHGLLGIRFVISWSGFHGFHANVRRGQNWTSLGFHQDQLSKQLAIATLDDHGAWRPLVDHLMETSEAFDRAWKQAMGK